MRKIESYIPSWNIEAFEKFLRKTKRNIPELDYSIGKAVDMVFRHYSDGRFIKQWHNVCPVTIEIPDENNWRLLASFEDGNMFVVDQSQKLVPDNPEHGKDYKVCDSCKHHLKNSYLIVNLETGEELQVGKECLKKFGLGNTISLAKFINELYAAYFSSSGTMCDGEYVWRGSDKGAFATIDKNVLFAATLAYYKENPKWKSGYYEGRHYYHSESNLAIQSLLSSTKPDEEYTKEVCEYTKSNTKPTSEFTEKMLELADNYYAQPADAAAAYFMVKAYEDYLKTLEEDYVVVVKGMQVHVTGNIIHKRRVENYYSNELLFEYTVLTPKGKVVKKTGKMPITDDNKTDFYSIVKNVWNGEITVDRALKNPKKGIEVIEL